MSLLPWILNCSRKAVGFSLFHIRKMANAKNTRDIYLLTTEELDTNPWPVCATYEYNRFITTVIRITDMILK